MNLTGLDRLLWALSLCGHCVLLAVLFVRGRVRTFPVFTTLISVNVLRTAVLYGIHRFVAAGPGGFSESYFYTYWTFATADVALQLAVAYELAGHVFRPLGMWAPDVRRSASGLVAASVLIAFCLTMLATPPTQTWRLAVAIRGSFFSSALMSELFVAMVALSVTLGLPWRTHVARLAQGFGVFSLFGIFMDAGHSYFGSDQGKHTFKLLSHLQIELYLGCVAYWIVTLALKEPEPRRLPERLHQELRALQSRAVLILESLRATGSVS